MASSYGAIPASPAPAQTITITTGPSPTRVLKTILNVFRVVHLVLNVICIVLAANSNQAFIVADDETGGRIFLLLVTVILAVASLSLIIWYRVASRHGSECTEPKLIHEVAYYSIGSVSLFIASVVVFASKAPLTPFPIFSNPVMHQAAGVAIFNAGLYLASAIMIYKLPRTN